MNLRHLFGILTTLIIGITLIACGDSLTATVGPTGTAIRPTIALPSPTATPTAAEKGRLIFDLGGEHELYRPEYTCIHCHSLDGADGDGPTLKGISSRAADRVPELTAEEYIHQSIIDPYEYLVEGYGNTMTKAAAYLLTEEEIDDLVAFLLTQ